VTNERIQVEIHAELERLKAEDVTDAELERFKTRAKADLIRELDSNEGLANELADYHRLFGDWRELFRSLERIDAVTKADVRRVAAESLKPTNRTVAQIVSRPPPAPPSEPAPQ
jgi:predicted Zn-dependent peptidase